MKAVYQLFTGGFVVCESEGHESHTIAQMRTISGEDADIVKVFDSSIDSHKAAIERIRGRKQSFLRGAWDSGNAIPSEAVAV